MKSGPEPPQLQYERVGCLERTRTVEMMKTENREELDE